MKKWLEDNEIYFKTAAATLLSLMAIVVSWHQSSVSKEQNEILKKQSSIMETQKVYTEKQLELTDKQTELTKLQYLHSKEYDKNQLNISNKQLDITNKQFDITRIQQQNAENEDKIQKKSEFLLIQDVLMTALHNSTFKNKQLSEMTPQERIEYFDSLVDLMTNVRNNQILLRNEDSMKEWRQAALYFKLCKDTLINSKQIMFPDDSDPTDITKYKDTPELRLKFVQQIDYKASQMLWKLKDKLLRDSADAKSFDIYKGE